MGPDVATQLGTQLGNAVFKAMTTPKTPEELEAERQAQILRQQQEAERQAKIQKYLDAEAQKQKEKNTALDREAQDEMSLLDHKNVALSDDELLASDKSGPAPSLCVNELEGMSNDLNAFASEARREGVQFAVDDVMKTARRGAGDKLTTNQYAADYRTIKSEVDKVKKEADYISEIQKCIGTKGCSLIELSKKYDQEFKDWVKGLSSQGVHEAADRVDKAATFYQDYAKRLEQHNEKIINGAAKCISN